MSIQLHTGAVSAAEVKWVVVDWYWRDQKLRRFSDVPEVPSWLS